MAARKNATKQKQSINWPDGVPPGLLDAAIEIAEKRKAILEELRAALISDDLVKIKRHARRLCGLGE